MDDHTNSLLFECLDNKSKLNYLIYYYEKSNTLEY